MGNYYQFIERHEHDGVTTAKYESTLLAQGAWNEHEQHVGAATGIICHELEAFAAKSDNAQQLRIGRISLDIWGIIHFGEFEVSTQIIRHGRTIELVESSLVAQGKTCIVARAWRMVMSDTRKVAGIEDQRVESPHDLPVYEGMSHWGGGFINSLIFRANAERRSGKGLVWVHSPHVLITGQKSSDFVKLMSLVDVANGTVPRINQADFLDNALDKKVAWVFPNLDIQIHLFRKPAGQWLGLDTVQQIGDDGIGLSSSVLHDEQGPFGRSEQIITVREV